MKRNQFDHEWAPRLQSEGNLAAPESFLGELGGMLRTMPPPAPPVPESFIVRHRKGLAVSVGALFLGFGLLAGSGRKPHNPAGLAIAVQSVNEQVAALPETTTSFTAAAYEREWAYIKKDAEKLAAPFPVSAFGLARP